MSAKSGRSRWIWILALSVTLLSAVFQRLTGPTYPVRIDTQWHGQSLHGKLTRTHGGAGDQILALDGVAPGSAGDLLWRRYPSREAYRRSPLNIEDGTLRGALPHQPPAGKLEYRLELHADGDSLKLPAEGTVVTRFKGAVPLGALLPHIVLMFLGMLLSNRAGLEALMGRGRLRLYAWLAFGSLSIGGMILGPIVQKHAFGAYWTGIPFGHDLTDNKTLIAFVAWGAALLLLRLGIRPRSAVSAAAVITLLIFLIPHSLLGSELSYE